ncbi:RNA-binding domain-containing protein [Flagelloscypha sp. PMI_526]|nr:RNA-binding domain-containing protein [Flagelloscypha sp. PMI_526]
MEEGAKAKKTLFIGNVAENVDQAVIIQHFSTFGDILDVQIPPATTNPHSLEEAKKHRGFAFVTFSSTADAQDAIDNMDMNEMAGRVIKVHVARPGSVKAALQSQLGGNRAIWESEDWLKHHLKPLDGSKDARDAGPPAAEDDAIMEE